ncbi:glycosyltransferase family 2 protein [Liquorilactobacillus hordei]|uniref:glycosyltransferase family 2 protein n=1 Tax=Liquorilactobacillus hordei TaxID=468911 RepID=UPI001CBDA654|nr:glycosyltransferase [Liquorilactobacillus hordei]MBZ2405258.1 glycosyl transferase family 2 [Liquorilactobacillus hordei]
MNPKLSIIIPVYNVEKYLKRCLDVLCSNQYTSDYEIILVDDGSNDKSSQVCTQYSKKFKNIFFVSQSNQGVSVARNKGIEISNGDFLCFVDPDDLVDNQYLKKIFSVLNDNYEIFFFAYKNVYKGREELKKYPQEGPYDKKKFVNNFESLFLTDMFYTVWNKVYKKSFLIKNKIYFENYSFGEDTRFNFKCYELVDSIFLSNKLIYSYYVRRGGSVTSKFSIVDFEMQIDEIKKMQELLKVFGRKNAYLISKLSGKIIVNACNSVCYQKSKTSKKNITIIKILTNNFVKNYLLNYKKFNLWIFLLKYKFVHTYILFRKFVSLFKEIF